MYKERGTRVSKSEVVDQKCINKVHDNRASHLLSHTVNGKGKAASNSVTIGKQLHDHNSRDSRSASLSKVTISDGEEAIETVKLLALKEGFWYNCFITFFSKATEISLKGYKMPENGGKLSFESLFLQPKRAKTAFQDIEQEETSNAKNKHGRVLIPTDAIWWSSGPKMTVAWKRSSIIQLPISNRHSRKLFRMNSKRGFIDVGALSVPN
uniref:Uncharacterized protein n=1 Tax=Brassica oleracea TaxID=3712 RepID=A0A3P6ARE7_BRAOL|nr:unnamed protein product [Brassica oleracea]